MTSLMPAFQQATPDAELLSVLASVQDLAGKREFESAALLFSTVLPAHNYNKHVADSLQEFLDVIYNADAKLRADAAPQLKEIIRLLQPHVASQTPCFYVLIKAGVQDQVKMAAELTALQRYESMPT